MRYWNKWKFTLDKAHGFGILFRFSEDSLSCQGFYEDQALAAADPADTRENSIDYLLRLTDDRWIAHTRRDQVQVQQLLSEASFRFVPGKDDSMHVLLSHGGEAFRVNISKARYSYDAQCSCGTNSCAHIKAAGLMGQKKLEALQHAYIASRQDVDKSLFLDPALNSAVRALDERVPNQDLIEAIRDINRMTDEAGSDDYYRLFYRWLLALYPYHADYDSAFLEEYYSYLLLSLYENPGFRRAVVEQEDFAAPEAYEERQHRSNRACMKRVLKNYGTAIRDMEKKGDYSEDDYKELLLKYRGDLSGLLRYYAEGKSKLEACDLPFLREILKRAEPGHIPQGAEPGHTPQGAEPAEIPEIDARDPQVRGYIMSVAKKLDEIEAEDLFRLYADSLPSDERVELFSCLKNITIPMKEVLRLSPEDQLKLINSIPLTVENFCTTMDTLLKDSSSGTKGRYILSTLRRLGFTRSGAMKEAILSRARSLPDSFLLASYAADELNVTESPKTKPVPGGDPERELTAYFSCSYETVNEGSYYYTLFHVTDPETDTDLLTVQERPGRALAFHALLPGKSPYTAQLVRRVCLAGHQEEYRAACEENQDAVDRFLFQKEHRKFAEEYQAFCDSLASERLVFAEQHKAGIDWLLYRNEGSNALAFKVGHSRKYVVKDAADFIEAFKTGRTTEYGKDLVLTHDPDNLNEEDAAVIRLLSAARFTRGRKDERSNRRYITVSDAVMGRILELLAGRTVFFNEVPCRLRLDPLQIRLKISDSYSLSTSLDPKTQSFMNLGGSGYVLTGGGKNGDSVIDRADAPADAVQLIDLAVRNAGISVKPILKDFRQKIYSRFFESFDVEKKAQKEFSLSRIRLNTYFDYESGVISERTEILKEGKAIAPGELTERIDRVKYDLLQSYLGTLGFSEGQLSDDGLVLSFFKLDFTRLKELTHVYLSESLKNKELKSIGRPVIRVAYQNNLVRVFLEKSDYSAEELEQILAGLRKKKKYILLQGDRIVDLDSEAARDFGDAVSDFGMDPKDLYREKTVSFVTAIKAFSHERSCRPDRYLRNMIEEIRSFKEAELPLPSMNATLRSYQEEGFRWLSILSKYNMGGILADDMGLGKTLQVIALLKADPVQRPSLVVCPKSLVLNWVSEFARFDGNTPVTAVYGTDSRRSEIIRAIRQDEKGVYITSYDSLRNDISKYTCEFNYSILDEAQYIKNVHALKTRSVKELKAAHRFALTGTPIENSVADLWSIFDYIMPGYFEDLNRFKDSSTEAIARKAAPFILRRIKADVLEDLPDKYERILSAEMSTPQRKLYEAMRNEARTRLEEGGKAFDLLPYLTRLRQICVDPGMFTEGYEGGSGKMELLSSLIPEYLEKHHRILVFSQFVKGLERLRAVLAAEGIPCYFLSGSTPAAERMEMMDAFNNGSGTDVFLISLKAGGTGLNLTGADTVIHLDPWWNVAAENQASDRTHRIGQTRNVEVIRLIAADSIEQRVVELQDIKKEVIRQVISDNDGSVTSASLADISFVLE